jgi:hypothetical protein
MAVSQALRSGRWSRADTQRTGKDDLREECETPPLDPPDPLVTDDTFSLRRPAGRPTGAPVGTPPEATNLIGLVEYRGGVR